MWLWKKARKNIEKYTHWFWNPVNRISFVLNGVRCGTHLRARGKIWIKNFSDNDIVIGDNFTFNSGNWLCHSGGDGLTTLQAFGNGKLTIGNNVGISNAKLLCTNEITIGDGTFLGFGTTIMDSNFHTRSEINGHKNPNEKPASQPIRIGSHCFIGANTIIMRGTTIDDGARIVAGSVVTGGHIKADEVWGGNPAKQIKTITFSKK